MQRDFVEKLIRLTNKDRIQWQHYDVRGSDHKFDSDIAYSGTWILCLDTVRNSLVLQVAESFDVFTELTGSDYGLGDLDLAIASQYRRRERMGIVCPPIAADKIAKFVNDKVLKAQKESEEQIGVLEKCLKEALVKKKEGA